MLDWTMHYPPLGLMSVAASLGGHEVRLLDMKVEKPEPGGLAALMDWADFVGISVLTPSVDSGLELCAMARQRGAMTVLGGPHPSLMPQLAENPDVDVVVRGDGEIAMREIADGHPLSSISGISYMEGTELVHNPDRPPIDLSTLPPPRRDLIAANARKYKAFGISLTSISTARGCPYKCSFCCVHEIWHGYRQLSPPEVVQEIKRAGHAEIVSVVDDNFCYDMHRVDEICDLIIQDGLDDRLYSVFSRVDSIVRHPEVVAKMARANMRVVFIGIEAASQEALDRMNKNQALEDIFRACEILESNGIMIWGGFIVGNPDDTWEDVQALIKMSRKLPIDIAQFTIITPYPGTELYRYAWEAGLIEEMDFAEYCECEPAMRTPNLSTVELMELEIKAYIKFYSIHALLGNTRRWSKNPAKKWVLTRNLVGYFGFWQFRNKSAWYFWLAYKEAVSKAYGMKMRRHSLLISTPALYALGTAVAAALIALFGTMWAVRYYGQYSSRATGFLVADMLFACLLVGFVTGLVGSWAAGRSYMRGWILSLKKRKGPNNRASSLGGSSLINGVAFASGALAAGVVAIAVVLSGWSASQLTYGFKEVLVTCAAFLSAGWASYRSIMSVRNRSSAK